MTRYGAYCIFNEQQLASSRGELYESCHSYGMPIATIDSLKHCDVLADSDPSTGSNCEDATDGINGFSINQEINNTVIHVSDTLLDVGASVWSSDLAYVGNNSLAIIENDPPPGGWWRTYCIAPYTE